MARQVAALDFTVRVDDARVLAALADSRSELSRDVREVMLVAARRKAVPLANAYAPRFTDMDGAKGHVIANASQKGAYLTFRSGLSKMARARDAMFEFGGAIRTPLAPKKAHALLLADGTFRMTVTKPRHIKGKHYMQRATDESIPTFIRELEREIPRLIQRRIDSMARL